MHAHLMTGSREFRRKTEHDRGPKRRQLRHWRLQGVTAMLLAFFSAAVRAEVLFVDGFESGDTSAWSSDPAPPDPCTTPIFTTSFAGDGVPWPAGWSAAGGVQTHELVADRSELVPAPSNYSLARMVHPVSTQDVEVRFTVRFSDASTQGVGFYVRQNGGYLHETMPQGEGYAVFVEAFRGPGIGVWREVNGAEQHVQITFNAALGLVSDVDYRVRFRAYQLDATTTMLQGKVWPAAEVEPYGWQVEATDSTPSLQNIAGGIAIDSWSSIQEPNPISAATIVDDVEIVPLCHPLDGLPALSAVTESYSFTEGPLWREDHLLFTDLDLAQIERLDPPAGLSTHRAMSNEANGLALNPQGQLLAAERNPAGISIDMGAGPVTWLDEIGGLGFNAPNDIAVRSDGVVYFTDPTYGMVGASELGYNGLFRVTPAGPSVVAEWEGQQGGGGTNQPNGVVLSPDERLLFVTDSEQGNLLVWSVNPDGSLSYIELMDNGLNIPDGMCIGPLGNLWVATWANTLEVYSMDGTHWGSVSVPQQATNCAFGGSDGRTLYVTAQTGLYVATLP